MQGGPVPRGMSRARTTAVRLLAVLGLASYSLMLGFVVAETAGVVRTSPVGSPDDPAPSAEALAGAASPGEAVHLVGSLGALVLGASGLVLLAARPAMAAAARQVLAASVAMLVATLLVGNPDNVGGQAGLVDPAFLVLSVPPLAAALLARPLGDLAGRRPDPALGALAAVAFLPAAWWGTGQALTQRGTFPPTADPHHQAHWFAMAVFAFAVVLVVAAACAGGRGWRTGTTTAGLAVSAFGAASLVSDDAGSAVPVPYAVAAVAWGLAVLLVTWRPGVLPGYGRSATSSATGLRTPV